MHLPTPHSPRAVCLALGVLGLILVLGACGTSSASETTLVTDEPLVAPTPIPTTAPLSLPAADDTLPALAPLPATITVAATPSAAVTPATPTPAPAEIAAAEAAPAEAVPAATEPAVAETSPAVVTSQWSECVVEAARTVGAVDLLDPIASGTTVDLSSVQLNSLATASVGCDVVTANLAGTDLGDHIATSTNCMNAWLESSGGGSVFAGLESIARGQATPVWAQTHLVDALDSCFTGASFAADVMADVAADSTLNGAFDSACLAASFDASGTLRSYAQRLVADPASATLYVTLSDSWVLSCANVGQMVAAAAAADGVGLSASSVSCIDAELKNNGLVAQLVAGTADADVVGIATLACLTSAESTALFG